MGAVMAATSHGDKDDVERLSARRDPNAAAVIYVLVVTG
jgi:hypothetical protein